MGPGLWVPRGKEEQVEGVKAGEALGKVERQTE